jgi:SAM-dependent methyltransferase
MSKTQMTMSEAERVLYEDMWEIDSYARHSPGEHFAPVFDSLVKERCAGRGTVLDAGCGSGKGSVALAALGYDVMLCDLTPAGLIAEARSLPFLEASLWSDLRKVSVWKPFYDWVYCTDVLEHLPTQMVGLTVSRLLEVARRGVFISVSLLPDQMGVWAGRPLHLTVQGYLWWRDLLRELGTVVDARDLIVEGVFLVEPRR